MELVSGILVFVVGLATGVGIMIARNRLDSGSQQVKKALSECQQSNAQLKQEWQDHLATFRSVATNLNEMSSHIQAQVEDAEQLLNPPATSNAFPFFSKEATQILQSAGPDKRERSQVSDQPLDYSNTASGVFQGNQKRVNE